MKRISRQRVLLAEYRLTGRMPVGLRVRWSEDNNGSYIGTFIGPRADGMKGFAIRAPEKALKKEPRFRRPPQPNCWFAGEYTDLEPYDWWGKE